MSLLVPADDAGRHRLRGARAAARGGAMSAPCRTGSALALLRLRRAGRGRAGRDLPRAPAGVRDRAGLRYLDADGADPQCWHLTAWSAAAAGRAARLCAHRRAGVKYPEASIGRVITSSAARGTGWAVNWCGAPWPKPRRCSPAPASASRRRPPAALLRRFRFRGGRRRIHGGRHPAHRDAAPSGDDHLTITSSRTSSGRC